MLAIDALVAHLVEIGAGTIGLNATILKGSDAVVPLTTQDGPVIVTIASAAGGRRQKVQNGGGLRSPHFQIVFRHKVGKLAEAAAHAAWPKMDLVNVTLGGPGGVFFLHVVPMQEPFDHGKDTLGNARHAFNVETLHRY